MNKRNYIKVVLWMLVCPILFLFVLEDQAGAQSSTGYQLVSSVYDQAGATSQSSNHKVLDAMGQASPLGISNSSNYIVISGFLAGMVTSSSTSVEPDVKDFLQEFHLFQNYPNPFRTTTTIRFVLPEAGEVKLEVYTLLGKHVATLLDAYISPGAYTVDFDASTLSSGVYMYKLQSEHYQAIKKMSRIE